VLALAVPTYGIPHVVHPWQTVLGVVTGTVSLVLLGITIGLAVPSARAAQAIGLLAFFPIYLLGGGGPPRGAMTGPMQAVSDVLPSTVPAITEPWLGVSAFSSQLAALAAWGAAALAVSYWLARRRGA
jgi:ABC-2 type transport system permease protein